MYRRVYKNCSVHNFHNVRIRRCHHKIIIDIILWVPNKGLKMHGSEYNFYVGLKEVTISLSAIWADESIKVSQDGDSNIALKKSQQPFQIVSLSLAVWNSSLLISMIYFILSAPLKNQGWGISFANFWEMKMQNIFFIVKHFCKKSNRTVIT